jgi:uncharacterized repeat protein (TIGR03987 family)
MSQTLIIAVVTTLLALIFYSFGVWGAKISKRLMPVHANLFWIGLVFDAVGSTCMAILARKLDLSLHGLTGILAFGLMAANAVWATIVLTRKEEKAIVNFHKFSIVVWLIWLIPFFSGMIMGMRN